MTKVYILVGLIILYFVLLTIWIVRHSRVYTVDSFKKAERLYSLPVVSMYEGDTKLNFLIDTGSTDSHMIPSILRYIHFVEGESLNVPIYGYGTSGKSQSKRVTVTLDYNSDLVKADFIVHDMIETSLQQAFSAHNITIHGILGNDFLKKNKYIVDYSDSTIKRRK